MNSKAAKPLILSLTVVVIFSLSFYLSSQRNKTTEITAITDELDLEVIAQTNQEISLKQKLVEDFETAFFKQYTPPVGCEVLLEKNKSVECKQHLHQAKNEYKADFIKYRGLPKNTFEELKLSFTG